MSKFIFDLGLKVKDSLTGFQGVIAYRAEYLTGCNQYGIQPWERDKDGDVRESKQFDENRLVVLKDKPYALPKPPAPIKLPGGPQQPVAARHTIK